MNDLWIIDEETGCWIWQRAKARGYGRLQINNKHVYAHRLMYENHVGPLGNGMSVCHACDTPACVNPEHLWLGTQKENIRDCVSKGRMPRHGELSNRGFLTEDNVRAIREHVKGGRTQASVAIEYGVTNSHVSKIVRRVKWPHI